MHGRRGFRVQRRRHVHAVPSDVPRLGRYLITTTFKLQAARTALHMVHLGTCGPQTPRHAVTYHPGQATASSFNQLWRTDYLVVLAWLAWLAEYTVSYHTARCLCALITSGSLVQSGLVSLVMTDPTVRLRLAFHTR